MDTIPLSACKLYRMPVKVGWGRWLGSRDGLPTLLSLPSFHFFSVLQGMRSLGGGGVGAGQYIVQGMRSWLGAGHRVDNVGPSGYAWFVCVCQHFPV